MTDTSGRFIWYELMSPDPDAADGFYREVVGWTFVANDEPARMAWITA